MKKKRPPNRRVKVKGYTLEIVSPEHPFSDATPEERVQEQKEMLEHGGIHPAVLGYVRGCPERTGQGQAQLRATAPQRAQFQLDEFLRKLIHFIGLVCLWQIGPSS